MSPKITTVIPTHNRIDFLKIALASALRQTFKDIKILILDNCSQDGTEDYVRALAKNDNRVFYCRNTKNIGSSANIRLGIEMVDTEFFSVLCDDNFLEPDFYHKALNLLMEYPDCGFVAFDTDIVDINYRLVKKSILLKNKIKNKAEKYYALPAGFKAVLNDEIPMDWTGYVFSKSAFPDIDFGEFSEFGHGQDIVLIWRFASRLPFVVNNIKGATYVAHRNSISGVMVKTFD